MRIYVPGDATVPAPHLIGGKAAGLMRLREASGAWRVPPFVVLLPDDDNVGALPIDELRSALTRAGVGPQARLAIRSSAAVEDGSSQSFAGQFESVLGVRADDRDALSRAIERVRASATSDRVNAYHDSGSSKVPMAVVVQEMVDAEASGVAFSVDPVAPASGLGVVSAVPGLGEGLVSGALDADTWWVSVNGSSARTVRREVVDKPDAVRLTAQGTAMVPLPVSIAAEPTLTDDEVSRVAAVTADVAARTGTPMDVEWALGAGDASGKRTLFLLQARPITTLRPAPRGARRLWDNSNIAESYSGVTTPLTFTFARSVYEDAYRQFFRIMGVSPERIEQQRHVFANMLGLVRGRVYYNLLHWYQALSLLPGFRFNRSFMERMMGVRESVTDPLEAGSTGGRFGDAMHLVRTLAGMLLEARRLPSEVPAFQARVDGALAPLTPEHVAGLSGDEAVALYRKLEGDLLRHWRAPLVNDFFAMIYFGVLGRLTERWLSAAPPTLVNDLLVGDGDIVSTQPARSVMQIARLVRDTPAASAHFQLDDDRAVWQRLVADPESTAVLERFREHLRRFGDRTMEELKLETITLGDDPGLLVGMVRAYLATSAVDDAAAFDRERKIRSEAEAMVDREMHGFKRLVFGHVLSRTRLRVRDRENLRFERTRVFGVVRRIFLTIGKELADRGHLAEPRDVFYLVLEEVFEHFNGTSVSRDLRALTRQRKDEFAGFVAEPAPPDRLETFGPLADWRPVELQPAINHGEELKGTGCCPGVVRGTVRVVTDPRGARDLAGNILVAERTDPGWTLLFPVCSGLLVQRGSLLSHSAIVAREMGLPCIVGLPGLMSWLKDGDEVEMDGATGLVRRLTPGGSRVTQATREDFGIAIELRAPFHAIRYGNVWEDADVLCEALRPVAAGEPLLSIASAGDNALALLTLDPSSVTAVDLSRAQLACLYLRLAAFRRLDHDGVLRFLGVRAHVDRLAAYAALRDDLPRDAASFWDGRPADIALGVVHTGKFESYFRLFRRWILPLAVSARERARLLAARDVAEQHRVYEDWNTPRWRLLFRVFFSRLIMGRLGRDPEFFREVDGPVADRILERTRYALTELPANTNPFLVAILTGNFGETALPRYLRPEYFDAIKSRLERVRVRFGRVEETGEGPFAGFNLSDVFEYMPPREHERVYQALVEQASPGARLVYWNMLAPRGVPDALRNAVTSCDEEAALLHARDRAWFYSRLHVDEVRSS